MVEQATTITNEVAKSLETVSPETVKTEPLNIDPTLLTEGTEDAETTLLDEGKEEAVKEATPEKYDVKLPEGMEVDMAMLEAFSPVFKELGLGSKEVQKLTDTLVPILQTKIDDVRKQAIVEYKNIVNEWKQETLKELGAEKNAKLALAAKARNKFGDESFHEFINELGVGNHPALVRFLMRVGSTISEDKFPDSTQTKKGDSLKVMYPTMK